MSNEISIPASNFADLIQKIQRTHAELSAQANKAINVSLTLRNWLIGLQIVEYEQGGADRAQYGTQLLNRISVELERLKIPRCEARELR